MFFLIGLLAIVSFGCRQQPTVNLRIVSYNIHHGLGEDGVLDLSRVAGFILADSAKKNIYYRRKWVNVTAKYSTNCIFWSCILLLFYF
jgi:hypothetical protein